MKTANQYQNLHQLQEQHFHYHILIYHHCIYHYLLIYYHIIHPSKTRHIHYFSFPSMTISYTHHSINELELNSNQNLATTNFFFQHTLYSLQITYSYTDDSTFFSQFQIYRFDQIDSSKIHSILDIPIIDRSLSLFSFFSFIFIQQVLPICILLKLDYRYN